MHKAAECIKQLTQTVGLADFQLGAAVTGYRGFASAYQSLDTCIYEAHAIDAQGRRGADWEVGIGQFFSDTGTDFVRRLIPLASSTGSAAFVSFAAGAKEISVSVCAAQVDAIRLAGPVTIYVRADGNDANSGFLDSPDHALLTLSAAVEKAAVARVATIQLGAGSFGSADFSAIGQRAGEYAIVGAGVGQTFVDVVSVTGATDVSVSALSIKGISATAPGAIARVDAVDFVDAGQGSHISAGRGGHVYTSSYSVSGGAYAHINCDVFGFVGCSGICTILGDISMLRAMIGAWRGAGAVVLSGATFDTTLGSVTGKRFEFAGNSIYVSGAGNDGAPVIPGSTDGWFTTGARSL